MSSFKEKAASIPLLRKGWHFLKPSLRGIRRCLVSPYARIRAVVGVQPLSVAYAADRGMPIHRYYIEQFLREHRADFRGACLEFCDPNYSNHFHNPQITRIDVLHVDDSNPRATLVADLTKENHLPSNHFDCIICTHVLHIIFDLPYFVRELHRILKPGGVVLVAVPQCSMNSIEWGELWRFTPKGLQQLLAVSFGSKNVASVGYGNALSSAFELRGLALHELTNKEISFHDPRYSLEVCARAQKE